MRILGLKPCFFPVCEGLEGGVVVGLGGDPGMLGGTLEWDEEPPRMGGGPLFDHFPDFNNFVKIGHDDDDDRHTLDPTPLPALRTQEKNTA